MITKGKYIVKILFVISILLVFNSINTIAEIGVRGLIGFLEWMLGASYIGIFLMANWDAIKK